jgi:arginase
MRLNSPDTVPEEHVKLKYLPEISSACEQLSAQVEGILDSGELPLILGGDHSIAIGSFAGIVSYYQKNHNRLV